VSVRVTELFDVPEQVRKTDFVVKLSDLREKSLNALRQLVDDLDGGRYPRLYVLITGTPAFFEGPQGIKRLPPLEQRLHVDFSGNPKFDSAVAPQVRLPPFDIERLVEVGKRVRDIYPAEHAERVAARVDDAVIEQLARGVTGKLGHKVGAAPRLFLRKLVGELLDKVDEHEDYVPSRDFELVVTAAEMTAEERELAGVARSVDDIALDLGSPSDDGP
jgi:type II secretory pathway predicted ATPase ExeA